MYKHEQQLLLFITAPIFFMVLMIKQEQLFVTAVQVVELIPKAQSFLQSVFLQKQISQSKSYL